MSRSRSLIAAAAALSIAALLGSARLLHGAATDAREAWPRVVDDPFAPSPAAASIVTLGYRELAADLLYIRLRIYYGGDDDTSRGFRGLIDAIVALDPHLYPIYTYAGRAVSWIDGGVTQDDWRWAAGVLERGLERFPDRWDLMKLAGEVYLLELKSDDPAEKARWQERGVDLLERAIRAPGAPKNLATYIAHVRSELGQQQRAVEGLIELIRTTEDRKARQRLIDKLAEIQGANADRIFAEELLMRERTDAAWRAALPEAPLEMYLRLGDPPRPYVDLGDLVAIDELLLDEDVLAPLGPGDEDLDDDAPAPGPGDDPP